MDLLSKVKGYFERRVYDQAVPQINENEISLSDLFCIRLKAEAEKEQERAVFRFEADGDEQVWLRYLRVEPSCREQGIATRLMSVAINLADEMGVVLGLNSSPDPDGGLDVGGLTDFYRKFGFETDWDFTGPQSQFYDNKATRQSGNWFRMSRHPAPANTPCQAPTAAMR